jgi:hypothetical protein
MDGLSAAVVESRTALTGIASMPVPKLLEGNAILLSSSLE